MHAFTCKFHSIPWQLHCNYKTYLHSLAKNCHVSRATVSLDSKWTLDPFRRHSRHSEIRVSRNSALWDSYLPEEKIRKNHTQHTRLSFANGSRVDFRVCLKATVEAKIKKNWMYLSNPLGVRHVSTMTIPIPPWEGLVIGPATRFISCSTPPLCPGKGAPCHLDISYRSPLAWRKLQKPIIQDVRYIESNVYDNDIIIMCDSIYAYHMYIYIYTRILCIIFCCSFESTFLSFHLRVDLKETLVLCSFGSRFLWGFLMLLGSFTLQVVRQSGFRISLFGWFLRLAKWWLPAM